MRCKFECKVTKKTCNSQIILIKNGFACIKNVKIIYIFSVLFIFPLIKKWFTF